MRARVPQRPIRALWGATTPGGESPGFVSTAESERGTGLSHTPSGTRRTELSCSDVESISLARTKTSPWTHPLSWTSKPSKSRSGRISKIL